MSGTSYKYRADTSENRSTNFQKRGRGRPATGQTPKRYFRMDDESWNAVEAAAEAKAKTYRAMFARVLLASAKRVLGRR